LEFKAVGVNGLSVVDEEKGIIETIVSVTGLRDNVKDVIHPGAYEKSLAKRTPKGVWSHSWDTPVSRTLAVKELLPGDPALPETLPNGDPWPSDAGALSVKTQFNLETQRGKEAYSDVVFFGDQQEWSIGYQVPAGGARVDGKSGVRHIEALELYEYSPVLFGAMPAARTTAGHKSLQFKSVQELYDMTEVGEKAITMDGVEFKSWLEEHGIEYKAKPVENSDDDPDEDDEDAEDDEETPDDVADDESEEDEDEESEDDDEEKSYGVRLTAYEREVLTKTIQQCEAALAADIAVRRENEFKSEENSLAAVVEAHKDALGDDYEEFAEHATQFDTAVESEDTDTRDEHGGAIIEAIDGKKDSAEDETMTAYKAVASAIATLAADEDEVEEEAKRFPLRPEEKSWSNDDNNLFDFEDDEEEEEEEKSGEDEPETKTGFVRLDLKELDALRAHHGFSTKRRR
jgi:Caudovirus prohead serine protease